MSSLPAASKPGHPMRRLEWTRAPRASLLLLAATLPLAACDEPPPQPPEIRPVRIIRAERRVLEEPVTLTGQIRAREEASLAFRTAGRIVERRVDVGDPVVPGQLIARLDAAVQTNAVAAAEAGLSAARS